MTFAEVIPMLLQDKKVKRVGWANVKYLDIFHGSVMVSHAGSGSWHWTPTKQDLEANDWEVAE